MSSVLVAGDVVIPDEWGIMTLHELRENGRSSRPPFQVGDRRGIYRMQGCFRSLIVVERFNGVSWGIVEYGPASK